MWTPTNPATLQMALQAPIQYNNEMPSGSPFDVIWDSGASITVSPNQSDFVGRYEKPPMMIKLSGLARGLNIKGQGHVMWAVWNMEGMLRVIKVPAYHVPGCTICLLSTSSLLQTYIGEQIIPNNAKLTLVVILNHKLHHRILHITHQMEHFCDVS
jgi:hypothetical protein